MVIFFARLSERYLERNGGPRGTLGGSIVTTAAVAGMAWAVRGRSSTVFGPSEWRGPKDRAEVALTFDDGPSLPRRISFVRSKISGFPPPSSNAACTCEGFPRSRGRSSQQVTKWRITLTRMHGCGSDRRSSYTMSSSARRTASRDHGNTPALFRAPYGVRWFGVEKAQKRIGLKHVMWSTSGRIGSSEQAL